MAEQERPSTHDEQRRDFGAGKLGWPIMAAMAAPVAGFFVLGLAGLLIGLVVGALIFFGVKAAT
jgi:hypothetical protein